ncbi:hypothetical protein [Paenibacillus sp. YPG26]|uniref:hypothetical protein n=1 Tax=Paenibacillus sp. YPG26 TaxID=2878915 RepID=UPI00203ED5B4|nr:hypothetical protein [Paenibacillus sp. YPG26]USB35177.1 hypothetical protein LDO05_00040 [Paenibacillus sp. YPG26]
MAADLTAAGESVFFSICLLFVECSMSASFLSFLGEWPSTGDEKHRTEEKNNDIIIGCGDFSSFLRNEEMPIS